MARFVAIAGEKKRTQYLNLELVRAIQDHPDEDGVVVVFDEQHKVYFGRDQAAPLLKMLRPPAKTE